MIVIHSICVKYLDSLECLTKHDQDHNVVRFRTGYSYAENIEGAPGGIKVMVKLDFQKSADGLLPAIAQDHRSGDVLMLAYINEDAWNKTLETGKAHYWSRSRNKIWLKGESSGNVQEIREILVDCDEDCVIYRVEQRGGAACHRGFPTCFHRKLIDESLEIVESQVFNPEEVYSSKG